MDLTPMETQLTGFETSHHSTRKFIMPVQNSTENCAENSPSLFQLVCIKIPVNANTGTGENTQERS
jgi:hypothetical protein